MSPGPKGHPTRPPKEPECARLEQVRTHFGVRSVRAFWQEVCDGWDDEAAPSYESARAYHDRRVPPAAYMARVAEVYGVSLRWLVTGEGDMDPEHIPSQPSLDSRIPSMWLRRHLPESAKKTLVSFFREVRDSHAAYYAEQSGPDLEGAETVTGETPDGEPLEYVAARDAGRLGDRRIDEVRKRVCELLETPFRGGEAWASVEELSAAELTSYVQAQLASWRPLIRSMRGE